MDKKWSKDKYLCNYGTVALENEKSNCMVSMSGVSESYGPV